MFGERTVQAAIVGIPLAMDLACGETVLTVALLSVLITAPLGAFLIDTTYRRLLEKKKGDAPIGALAKSW
mgnify:CR=1 FL=1